MSDQTLRLVAGVVLLVHGLGHGGAIVALLGFVVAAISFFGIALPGAWQPLAVACAIVSLAGIVTFAGTWPLFNTLAAVTVDVAVLVAVLVIRWPGPTPLG